MECWKVEGLEESMLQDKLSLKESANPSHTLLLARRTQSWENLFPAKSELKSDSEKLASEYEDA